MLQFNASFLTIFSIFVEKLSPFYTMSKQVSVRFAPSPTGPLHIGGVRTALYNYLFAKKHQGRFIVRIEDTDQARFIPGTEEYIFNTLQWLGIEADEDPLQGGPFGPYRQSERKEQYKEYALRLVEEGKAYYAFDTPEELEAMRKRLKATRVVTPQYNAISRGMMKNSLTLPREEVEARLRSGAPYVIRIKMPHKEEIRLYDLVRGWVKVAAATLDDKVLMKSDGMPTYHLAHVVDDHLMKITHVIRGEEWLPSAPMHVLLHRYLGWEETMPQFAHLPLLLKPDGKGKLSKRDAEKHGFPLFPLTWKDPHTGEITPGFREEGYFPEALCNFLALLGWSPGRAQEVFSKEELINAFSIERIGKAGVKFDIHKAQWFNQQYLKAKPDHAIAQYLVDALKENNITCTQESALQVCRLMKERAVFPQDLWQKGRYFFIAPEVYDEKVVQTKWNKEVGEVIQAFAEAIQVLGDFQADQIKAVLMELIKAKPMKIGQVMPVIRVALTGLSTGPDLMQIIEIIGKEETSRRIQIALEKLGTQEYLSS